MRLRFAFFTALLLGCGGTDENESPLAVPDAETSSDTTPSDDALADVADANETIVDTAPAKSNIEHVVIIVQENHTFDSYFGRYCTATSGSSPTCTAGPSCCEAAPDKTSDGTTPTTLDDAANAAYDPNHTQSCEVAEMNGGKMDRFTSGASCSDKRNFAIAPSSVVKPYHDWAGKYALADRYFQSLAGASSANDMYFAVAKYVFTDNAYKPNSNGKGCTLPGATITYKGEKTIADLLIEKGHGFAFYAEGYAAMKAALLCPAPPSDCPFKLPTVPCDYDPSDVPFEYYEQFLDNSKYMKDYDDLAKDVSAATLPALSFVKHLGYHNEHPGYGTRIDMGVVAVQKTVSTILSSPTYGKNTLVLLTWDEGGGYYDHVAPPADSTVDKKPYGTRVPLLAIGRFAKVNHVSHVTMEHSSVVKFIELNFLGTTGGLGARDAVVENIGSLLDPKETGIVVP